jgi:hypothetical protein
MGLDTSSLFLEKKDYALFLFLIQDFLEMKAKIFCMWPVEFSIAHLLSFVLQSKISKSDILDIIFEEKETGS